MAAPLLWPTTWARAEQESGEAADRVPIVSLDVRCLELRQPSRLLEEKMTCLSALVGATQRAQSSAGAASAGSRSGVEGEG